MNTQTTTTNSIVDSNFAIDAVLEDKLDSQGIKLLSAQNKLIQIQKENNEKQG
jgi:hypothetical protein